jgi:hypothetical protein
MRALCIGILVMALASPAMAALQNITVGGEIEIWGHYYSEFYEPNPGNRWPVGNLIGRPIGPLGVVSPIRAFNDNGAHALSWVEQRTSLYFDADFTEKVRAFIELDSLDFWGEDFRSNYITGADMRGSTGINATGAGGLDGDVEVYQAFIEAREMFGYPVRLRIGRQELAFGSEWLVGTNSPCVPPTRLSFDAIRLTYTGDSYSVDAFWSKLAERSPMEEDGDTDFYGIYASCSAVDRWVFDAYWLYLRDGVSLSQTALGPFGEWFEDLWGVDNYPTTEIHTAGLRAAGEWCGFDLEAEAAYQWGEAGTVGAGFAPFFYGDDSAEYGDWGAQLTIGYTFSDVAWQPRVYLSGQYYGGEDNRDITFVDWLNPFYRPQASVSFNRLFSGWETDDFFDASNLSNIWMAVLGVQAMPSENLEVGLDVIYTEALANFDTPVLAEIGKNWINVMPLLPFWTRKGDTDLGWEARIWASYAYSDDLSFECGWAHLWTGDGIEDGVFTDMNGLGLFAGIDKDDADYVWLGTKLTF